MNHKVISSLDHNETAAALYTKSILLGTPRCILSLITFLIDKHEQTKHHPSKFNNKLKFELGKKFF